MSSAPFRLALVSDMLEERWFSMDLISDMLFDQLSTGYGTRCNVRQIRPALRRISSATRLTARSSRAWMLDRLLNRHVTYARYLRTRQKEFDLFHIVDHSYANLVTQLPAGRTVVTCHDLDAFRSLIEPRQGARARAMRLVMSRVLRGMQRAAHVIFVSHSVRNAALALRLVCAAKSSVIPMGVHPACTAVPDTRADREAQELLKLDRERHPVLLHVGSTADRKRLDVLLRVTAEVARAFPKTVLARVGGPLTPAQRQLAHGLKIEGRLLELPFLDRNVLAAVYRRADLVLQPSEAEGFGLPVVEAMACGCPVAASDLEVLREVGGAAAAYCPVGDVERWSAMVIAMLREAPDSAQGKAQRRQELAAYARRFSWAANAEQTVGVYEGLVRKGS